MSEEQSGEEKPAAEGGSQPAPRKELDGFRVTRAAPVQAAGPPMGLIVVVIALVVAGGLGFIKMNSGGSATDGGDTNGTDGTNGTNGTNGNGGTDATKDVPVPDYVTERLEFLDQEGNLEAALEYAEENEKLTPNRTLRAKIKSYRKELGLDVVALTPAQLAKKAKIAIGKKDFDTAIGVLDEALEEATEDATLYFLRGKAKGLSGDKLGAVGDLRSALELDYQPATEVEALLERFE
jgi:hypothetical protein